MSNAVERFGLSTFRRLPRRLRRLLVRLGTPRYTVGAAIVARDAAGKVLLVEQRHTGRWGLPGGLLRKGEEPADGVRREVQEELGLDLPPLGDPRVVVDARARRVDVVYLVELHLTQTPQSVSAEVLAARWFALDGLPPVTGPTAEVLRLTS